ncbi:MAG: hypothetical protein KF774_09045 [Planctomyces sp.]|nr:hypothetical protein [Planctomyces sp.]
MVLVMDDASGASTALSVREGEPTRPMSSRIFGHREAGCLTVLATLGCWWFFLMGAAASLADLFGGPPPPISYFYFGLSLTAGLMAMSLQFAYARRCLGIENTRGTLALSVLVLFGCLANIVPMSLSALSLSEWVRDEAVIEFGDEVDIAAPADSH